MRSLLLIVVSALFTAPVGVAPGVAQSEPGAAVQPSVGQVVIDTVARRILTDYYQRNAQAYVIAYPDQDGGGGNNKHKKNKQKGLPPGIAKKGTLPPGIAKQLVRNGHLPPGLEYQPLPPDLIVQLPAVAPAYRYVIADDRVMLIQSATNVILDILQVPGI
jgi:hypothetical protein